jgi:deoxyribose-phosphate aldolase
MARPSLASLLSPGAFDRPVDQVGADERAAKFTKRSIKSSAKVQGLRMVVAMTDLTTLEGKDSPGKVRQMCAKAVRPDPNDPSVPSVAAVCVYPALVKTAKQALVGSGVGVASVATSFPSGQTALDERVEEVERAVADGADEIDMVINRRAFMQGDYETVYEEIVAVKRSCGAAHLKTILETGELETYDNVRRASHIAMEAGSDFIKTSTGKVTPAATMPVTLVMLEAIREHYLDTGRRVGMKPAGGIRAAKLALHYLVMVKETLGDDWLTPSLFRFGASTLLNDVLMQLAKQRTGNYQSGDYFTLD